MNLYKISKRMEIAGSHRLDLTHESKCSNIHGHNWIVTVHCKSEEVNENGMIVDFKHIKDAIHNKLDHQHLNDILEFNPTAENIAKWVVDSVDKCYKAEVQESEGNIASYEI